MKEERIREIVRDELLKLAAAQAEKTRTYDLDDPEDQQAVREHFEGLREKGYAVRVE